MGAYNLDLGIRRADACCPARRPYLVRLAPLAPMSSDSCKILDDPAVAARHAYQAAPSLASISSVDRSTMLLSMAAAIRDHQNAILEANTLDLEATLSRTEAETANAPPIAWLKLTPERLKVAIDCLNRLAEMPDPIRPVTSAALLAEKSQAYSQLMPLGAIAFIWESLPEIGMIAAGMCLKTGNSLVLHPSPEARETSLAIAHAMMDALADSELHAGSLSAISTPTEETRNELIAQSSHLGTLIAHGRSHFVKAIAAQSSLPVVRSVTGNCYLYWSLTGRLETVRSIVLDSYRGAPDRVNAIDKILVSSERKLASISTLWNSLREEGFEIRADAALCEQFPEFQVAQPQEWRQAYPGKTIAFKLMDQIELAMLWIDQNSSGHANVIVTESYRESCLFTRGLSSASVFVNASPRFTRLNNNAVYLGMSNQAGAQRGFLGLETLTRLKYVVQGY
jgi:glutamate-5-semialdehyde dehydrogenase